MTTSTLYHTQGIRGFKYEKTQYQGQSQIYYIVAAASHLPCPSCRSKDTTLVQTMSNAYAAWLREVIPQAQIVYDHFHVIKLMNERMDALRRKTMNELAEEQKKELKGKRYLLLRGQENLTPNAEEDLQKLRLQYKDLV